MLEKLAYKMMSWLERKSVQYIQSQMEVGRDVEIRPGLRVKHPENITLADYVSIGQDVTIQAHEKVVVGEHSLIATGTIIATAAHPMDKRGMAMRDIVPSPVTIGKNCWIGAGCLILPGVTIGDGVVLGAGAVVTKDLPENMICVGAPARPIKPRPAAV